MLPAFNKGLVLDAVWKQIRKHWYNYMCELRTVEYGDVACFRELLPIPNVYILNHFFRSAPRMNIDYPYSSNERMNGFWVLLSCFCVGTLFSIGVSCDKFSQVGSDPGQETNRNSTADNSVDQQESDQKEGTSSDAKKRKNLTKIMVGGTPAYVELATTEKERKKGLKHRSSLGEDRGMLFIFPKPAKLSFWMKDTHIPLDLAYIDRDFRITEIHPLIPLDRNPVYSSERVQFALEMNRGWFQEHDVEPGDRIDLPEEILPD